MVTVSNLENLWMRKRNLGESFLLCLSNEVDIILLSDTLHHFSLVTNFTVTGGHKVWKTKNFCSWGHKTTWLRLVVRLKNSILVLFLFCSIEKGGLSSYTSLQTRKKCLVVLVNWAWQTLILLSRPNKIRAFKWKSSLVVLQGVKIKMDPLNPRFSDFIFALIA